MYCSKFSKYINLRVSSKEGWKVSNFISIKLCVWRKERRTKCWDKYKIVFYSYSYKTIIFFYYWIKFLYLAFIYIYMNDTSYIRLRASSLVCVWSLIDQTNFINYHTNQLWPYTTPKERETRSFVLWTEKGVWHYKGKLFTFKNLVIWLIWIYNSMNS